MFIKVGEDCCGLITLNSFTSMEVIVVDLHFPHVLNIVFGSYIVKELLLALDYVFFILLEVFSSF